MSYEDVRYMTAAIRSVADGTLIIAATILLATVIRVIVDLSLHGGNKG